MKQKSEQEQKLSLQRFRETLNQQSDLKKKNKELEKQLQKISEEIKSKLQRMKILSQQHLKLTQRNAHLKDLRVELENQAQLN